MPSTDASETITRRRIAEVLPSGLTKKTDKIEPLWRRRDVVLTGLLDGDGQEKDGNRQDARMERSGPRSIVAPTQERCPLERPRSYVFSPRGLFRTHLRRCG